mmetsp:Transcript_2929/g.8918  ORF Transcript_2929/g.8918 Transcript_2929/m.8918 type:complete len:264 (+) Transcript_2929:164-955(+)
MRTSADAKRPPCEPTSRVLVSVGTNATRNGPPPTPKLSCESGDARPARTSNTLMASAVTCPARLPSPTVAIRSPCAATSSTLPWCARNLPAAANLARWSCSVNSPSTLPAASAPRPVARSAAKPLSIAARPVSCSVLRSVSTRLPPSSPVASTGEVGASRSQHRSAHCACCRFCAASLPPVLGRPGLMAKARTPPRPCSDTSTPLSASTPVGTLRSASTSGAMRLAPPDEAGEQGNAQRGASAGCVVSARTKPDAVPAHTSSS